MSCPNSSEINLVRCMKCGKVMNCSRYDTSALLDHIRNDHPEIDIIDTDTKQKRHFNAQPIKTTTNSSFRPDHKIEDCHCSDEEKCNSFESKIDNGKSDYSATSEILAKYPEIKECVYVPHNPNAQVAYTRRYKLSTPSPVTVNVLQQPFQHTLYRTSIEKWCPVNGSIFCPKCGTNKRPLIKTKAERFTTNECGACCLLSCWPFCFIPWILPGQNQEYLYCANCKTFLGLYDRQTNCLKPNRLYISSGSRQSKANEEPLKENWNRIKENKMLENESPPPPQGFAGNSAKSTRLSSVIVNGKELSPDAVARIEKYKRFSSLVGIDLNDLKESPNSARRSVENKEIAATPVARDD